jgi:hypothetical protein
VKKNINHNIGRINKCESDIKTLKKEIQKLKGGEIEENYNSSDEFSDYTNWDL